MVIQFSSEIQQSLAEACKWAGITQGRVTNYQKQLEKFHEMDTPSREALICTSDCLDILDVWNFWKDNECDFPGIKSKIRDSIEKGPNLPEDEKIKISGNRARNDLFVYLFAAKLIQAGVQILSIDDISRDPNKKPGHGDIIITFENEEILIECKRPQKLTSINSCAREANKQIQKSGRNGCIALDCSKAIRPKGTLLDFSNNEIALDYLLDKTETEIIPIIRPHLKENVLGAFLMVSVPGMKKTSESTMLSPQRTFFQHYTPFRVSTTLVNSNKRADERNQFARWAYDRLESTQGLSRFLGRTR